MTENTMKLMSHPGVRGRTGYEGVARVRDDLRPVASIVDEAYTEMFAADEHGRLLFGRPLDQQLLDAEVRGDTILFDGDLPEFGCHTMTPVIVPHGERLFAYFPYADPSAEILVVRKRSARGPFGGMEVSVVAMSAESLSREIDDEGILNHRIGSVGDSGDLLAEMGCTVTVSDEDYTSIPGGLAALEARLTERLRQDAVKIQRAGDMLAEFASAARKGYAPDYLNMKEIGDVVARLRKVRAYLSQH